MNKIEIERWLWNHTDFTGSVQIESNGKVSISGNELAPRYPGTAGAIIFNQTINAVNKIPFEFETVVGNFDCGHHLRSLHGIPNWCESFACHSMWISGFENIPWVNKTIDVSGSALRDFKDILPYLKYKVDIVNATSCAGLRSLVGVGDLKIPFNIESINFSSAYVEKGGLGLLLIPGLKRLHAGGGLRRQDNANRSTRAFDIICEYAGRPDDIFECQMELIDNGLEEFAEL